MEMVEQKTMRNEAEVRARSPQKLHVCQERDPVPQNPRAALECRVSSELFRSACVGDRYSSTSSFLQYNFFSSVVLPLFSPCPLLPPPPSLPSPPLYLLTDPRAPHSATPTWPTPHPRFLARPPRRCRRPLRPRCCYGSAVSRYCGRSCHRFPHLCRSPGWCRPGGRTAQPSFGHLARTRYGRHDAPGGRARHPRRWPRDVRASASHLPHQTRPRPSQLRPLAARRRHPNAPEKNAMLYPRVDNHACCSMPIITQRLFR